ncbi:MAG: TIGR01459 family HAD-type hydrolase [Marinosulfonomonas sp.]|nr:MAG: TIGR01459 family HAD-type hydrolase [Marinosulfonomonas sp.]
MTNLIERLSDVSERYDALYVDLWGCLHNGLYPFSDAVAALQEYRAKGGVVMLLTNSPRPRPLVIAQLDQIGVPRDVYDDVTSSGDASQAGMLAGLVGNQIYHIGPDRDLGFFNELDVDPDASHIERVPLDQAEGIICTGLFDDQTEGPEDYRTTLLFAKQKRLKLLCTNPDLEVDLGEKRIYCAGAIAALYTDMGGESLYFGKPHPPIYDLARIRLAALKDVMDHRILCIGDGIRTDIQGGLGDELDTLFVTGGLAAGEFGDDPLKPDRAAIQAFYDREQISPTMAITQLR